jgi:DNA invertase Pin-like site-specific DNA recombinase
VPLQNAKTLSDEYIKMKSSSKNGFIAYYRVSSVRQGESGLGLEAQREAVLRFAGKMPIRAEFTEVESGKRHINRPQLLAALGEAKLRKATLLIAKLDRLARNVHFISGLMESGVDFIALDIPHANKLTLHIMAAMAEHEREMISQRTKAGLDAAKREIKANGFRISRRSGRKYSKHGNPHWPESLARARAARTVKPTPTAVLEMIRSLRSQGKTFRDITEQLNGLELKTGSGAKWYASTVRAALLA